MFVVFVLGVPLRCFVGMCSVGNLIYTAGVFDSVLQDANDFRSDTYNSIQLHSSGAEFQVTLGG